MKTLNFFIMIVSLSISTSAFADYNSALNDYNNKNYRPAFKEFLSNAKSGNINSQRMLITMFREGLGTTQSNEDSLYWLKRIIESGNGTEEDTLLLADYYKNGFGTNEDENAAIKLLLSPALENSTEAKIALAELYLNSITNKNPSQAINLYNSAAKSGDVESQYILAEIYRKGEITPKDLDQAAKWYEILSEKNHPDAQFHLGMLYLNGDINPANL